MEPLEDQHISELLSQAENSIVSRNFEEAISGCRTVLSISPENQRAKALMDEAQSKLEAELFAKENLRKAREFFNLRNFEKSVNECQKVLLLDPDNEECITLLNEAQQKKEAEPFVQNFVSSGRSLFDSGLYNEAIAQWEKVRAIDPNYPDLDRLIDAAKQKISAPSFSGQMQESEFTELPLTGEQEGEAFGFVSDQDRIQQLLKEGDQHFADGQYQKAIEVWSEIFMLDVNNTEALQKIEEARAATNQQRAKWKDLLKTAQTAYEQGDLEQARRLFNQIKTEDPENAEANRYLALIDKAEPTGLEDLIARGEAAEQQAKYREAAQFFSQALAIDSENAQLADRIKNLNLLAKKQEQGKTLLGNARGFVAEGKFDSARHALSKILETDPANQEALDLLRQIKETESATVGTGVTTAREARVSVGRKLPVIPVVAAVLVLAAAGVYYFFFYSSEDEPGEAVQSATRTAAAKPGVMSRAKGKPKAAVNETDVQKADRLVREANFYFQEKHYDEAIKRAEEALKINPNSMDAVGIKLESQKKIQDLQASERKLLDDANSFFGYSDFAGAVRLYEKYIDSHPEAKESLQPQIIKCYYNLGVIAIREWRCDTAADYFRQVLFIDETDQLSKDALAVARQCQKTGTTDIEVRKAVALMEMRR